MSERSARTAKTIVSELLKAKGVSSEVIRSIGQAERDSSRLLATVSQLGRGDVTGLMAQLATLGPKGIAAAVVIGTIAVGYEIYKHVTEETPSEVYHWRYPT